MTAESRIALFIDFENLVTNTGISASRFDPLLLTDRLLEKGKVVYRRAYCDWSRFRDAKAVLHEVGVELIEVPPSTKRGKNGADIRLVIDALELCYAREHIDTFALASGDSDFCPLAYKLRENNKIVIGLGARGSVSPFFVKACDEFIYLQADRVHEAAEREDDSPSDEPAAKPGAKPSAKAPRRQKRGEPRKAPIIPPVAREVVTALLARATGPLNPSLIKGTIIRKEPDFDERDHGFSTFSRLLQAMEKEGLLRREQQGRQWYVLSADAADGQPAPTETVTSSGPPEDFT